MRSVMSALRNALRLLNDIQATFTPTQKKLFGLRLPAVCDAIERACARLKELNGR